MTNRSQVAAIVLGAMLGACAFLGQLDRAYAGTITPSGNSPEAETGEVATSPQGRVYLFRGALGPIFSRGMDRLAKRLREAGIAADVYEFTLCRLIAARAVRDYQDNPAPIILIGHSMGGLCALIFAGILQDEHIPVSLVVTVDPAHASPSVPLNVERYINIFLSNSILGGGDVLAKQGYQGHYASFDLSRHDEVTHINIDKMDAVHDQLVTVIRQLAATPAKVDGETLPLRYVVPPDAPVELWDSGTNILAGPNDTLQTIAAVHHVPLWSLTQINPTPEDVPLVMGQRIAIPRHLMPFVTMSAKSPDAKAR
jgi:pimeloyl-ACP methyl ester carboxylesterase